MDEGEEEKAKEGRRGCGEKGREVGRKKWRRGRRIKIRRRI